MGNEACEGNEQTYEAAEVGSQATFYVSTDTVVAVLGSLVLECLERCADSLVPVKGMQGGCWSEGEAQLCCAGLWDFLVMNVDGRGAASQSAMK